MARKGKVNRVKAEKAVGERPERIKKYPYVLLVVCEDQNTEPTYFEQFTPMFPEKTVFLRAVGTGYDPLGVVQQSIVERDTLIRDHKVKPDEVWAVFDKDDADENQTKIDNFNNAFTLAESEGHNVAYSNEAFELWLLLHFIGVSVNTPIGRQDIYDELERRIQSFEGHESFVYLHGNAEVLEKVKQLGSPEAACRRAKVLLDHFQANGTEVINANPSTTVHHLIIKIHDLIEYWSYGS